MALPPWTVELLRRGVADLARQVTDHDAAASLKEQATKIVDELPKAAREKVGSILRQAEAKAQPIKDAWQSGPWWSGDAIPLTPTRIINATGCLLDERGSGVGLPADALAAAVPHLSGDAACDPDLAARLCDEISSSISRRRSHNQSSHASLGAIVSTSLDASLALVATLGGRGGCLWVPRSDAQPMYTSLARENCPNLLLVDRLRRFSRGAVREFGHASGSVDWPGEQLLHRGDGHPAGPRKYRSADDASQHARKRQNILVRLPSSQLRKRAEAESVADWIEVVVLPIGSVFPLKESNVVSSVIEQLDDGADLVVLAGGVLAGTPELSLIVGSDDVIQRLRQCPIFELVNAPTAMTAIVATSIAAQARSASPVAQLTSISQDNLADRAQRLATQLGGCDWVTSTRITEHPAHIGIPTNPAIAPHTADPNSVDAAIDSIASRQVVLTIDQSHDADALAQSLANGPTSLLCRVDNNELIIDLRWISSEQQAQISELISLQAHAV